MSDKIVSSLTDEEIASERFMPRLDNNTRLAIQRNIANIAAQRAVEEFKVIAKERERLLLLASSELHRELSGHSILYPEKIYELAGIEELK